MGMLADESRVDQAANNLANVDSPGFKKDRSAFRSYLDTHIIRVEQEDRLRHWRTIGSIERGVTLDEVRPDFSPGTVEITGRDLDFAVNGDALFTVQGPDDQVYYTRDGGFLLDAQGNLRTASGASVLNDAGEPIVLGADAQFDPTGSIFQDGVLIGRLGLVTFEQPEKLQKMGYNLFSETGESGQPAPDFQSVLVQGALEKSNVNAINEMVKLISAQRHYEISQRVITTEDVLMDAAINKVGSSR